MNKIRNSKLGVIARSRGAQDINQGPRAQNLLMVIKEPQTIKGWETLNYLPLKQ